MCINYGVGTMNKLKHSQWALLALAIFSLTNCSVFDDKDTEPRLPGERLSVMQLQKTLEVDPKNQPPQPIQISKPWSNAFWPQAGGYPNHAMQHIELPDKNLTKLWHADIGEGAKKTFPITSTPIVVDGRLFTLDSAHRVSAFSLAGGEKLWESNIQSQFEDDPVITGGIAYGDGQIFATNGYSEVIALDPKTGKITWRKSIPAPARAAPTIIGGRVFIATLDNRLLALAVKDGATLWEYSGLGEMAALVGAASPAASNDIVLPVFSSGELTALRVENGSVAWSDNLTRSQRFGGLNALSDIRAMPVIDQGQIFAISFGGRLVAIDQRTGARQWQRDIGGFNTPWVVGNTVFVLTSESELVALNRGNGSLYWVRKLPAFVNPEKKDKPILWHGPVFAGGRLVVTASTGSVIEINPENGENIRAWQTNHTIIKSPVVADKLLILLSNDGHVHVYR
jgi:outer membrane protein assembly factor BamB